MLHEADELGAAKVAVGERTPRSCSPHRVEILAAHGETAAAQVPSALLLRETVVAVGVGALVSSRVGRGNRRSPESRRSVVFDASPTRRTRRRAARTLARGCGGRRGRRVRRRRASSITSDLGARRSIWRLTCTGPAQPAVLTVSRTASLRSEKRKRAHHTLPPLGTARYGTRSGRAEAWAAGGPGESRSRLGRRQVGARLTALVAVHGVKEWKVVGRPSAAGAHLQAARASAGTTTSTPTPRGAVVAGLRKLHLVVARCHRLVGNAWARIAERPPGRTDMAVKNRFNTPRACSRASPAAARGGRLDARSPARVGRKIAARSRGAGRPARARARVRPASCAVVARRDRERHALAHRRRRRRRRLGRRRRRRRRRRGVRRTARLRRCTPSAAPAARPRDAVAGARIGFRLRPLHRRRRRELAAAHGAGRAFPPAQLVVPPPAQARATGRGAQWTRRPRGPPRPRPPRPPRARSVAPVAVAAGRRVGAPPIAAPLAGPRRGRGADRQRDARGAPAGRPRRRRRQRSPCSGYERSRDATAWSIVAGQDDGHHRHALPEGGGLAEQQAPVRLDGHRERCGAFCRAVQRANLAAAAAAVVARPSRLPTVDRSASRARRARARLAAAPAAPALRRAPSSRGCPRRAHRALWARWRRTLMHAGGRARRGRFRRRVRRSAKEHAHFVEGIGLYGRQWGKVAQLVGTIATSAQVRSHAQKYIQKEGVRGRSDEVEMSLPPRSSRRPRRSGDRAAAATANRRAARLRARSRRGAEIDIGSRRRSSRRRRARRHAGGQRTSLRNGRPESERAAEAASGSLDDAVGAAPTTTTDDDAGGLAAGPPSLRVGVARTRRKVPQGGELGACRAGTRPPRFPALPRRSPLATPCGRRSP